MFGIQVVHSLERRENTPEPKEGVQEDDDWVDIDSNEEHTAENKNEMRASAQPSSVESKLIVQPEKESPAPAKTEKNDGIEIVTDRSETESSIQVD